MAIFSVRGRGTNTSGNIGDCIGQLWNDDATETITVVEFWVWRGGLTGNRVEMCRSTARGTAGSTVTPDADNAWDNLAGPTTSVLLDLPSFTTDPTVAGPALMNWNNATGTDSMGIAWATAGGINVPPGTGIAFLSLTATVYTASEVTFVWEE